MLLHQASEEGDPQSIKTFLEMHYPQIVSSVSENVLAILVGHLAANGSKSMRGFEEAISSRIVVDIADAQAHGITDPEHIIVFLADLYTKIYGSQDIGKAVIGAGMGAVHPMYHEVVRRFYQMQAVKYLTGGVRPSCPFQGVIRKAAEKLVRIFVTRGK